jgi:hypothetical protein
MRVAAYQSLIGRGISRETIEQLLWGILRAEAGKTFTIDRTQKKVAEHFEVRIADMTSNRRIANIVFPRQVAMYLARHHTKGLLAPDWRSLRGPDHGTVLHARKTVSARIKKEDLVRQMIAGLTRGSTPNLPVSIYRQSTMRLTKYYHAPIGSLLLLSFSALPRFPSAALPTSVTLKSIRRSSQISTLAQPP